MFPLMVSIEFKLSTLSSDVFQVKLMLFACALPGLCLLFCCLPYIEILVDVRKFVVSYQLLMTGLLEIPQSVLLPWHSCYFCCSLCRFRFLFFATVKILREHPFTCTDVSMFLLSDHVFDETVAKKSQMISKFLLSLVQTCRNLLWIFTSSPAFSIDPEDSLLRSRPLESKLSELSNTFYIFLVRFMFRENT